MQSLIKYLPWIPILGIILIVVLELNGIETPIRDEMTSIWSAIVQAIAGVTIYVYIYLPTFL